MRDSEIDDILGEDSGQADPALLDRISDQLGTTLRPVRPMPPAWILALALFLSSTAIAVVGAAILGFYGFVSLTAAQFAWIFPVVGLAAWGASALSSAETIPGSRQRVTPPILLALCILAIVAVFALLFHDYATAGFVHWGVRCLVAGLIEALPTGLVAWLVLRRGLALNPGAAGLAAGTLAGLTGLAMLELHCPSHLALHVMIWHVGVVPIAALAGALIAWLAAKIHPTSAQR